MLTNEQIRKKEIYKCQQRQIKLNGELKQAQADLIASLNECALAEVCKYNPIQKKYAEYKCKSSLKCYFKVYGQVYLNQEHINELLTWHCEDK